MGILGEVWQVMHLGESVGEITMEYVDQPWFHGRFVARPGFAAVKPFFDNELASLNEGDFEASANHYREIEQSVSLVAPAGPISDFLLHIQDDHAWLRY